jgi:peptidoglycan DL-endopeptidase CwlO
MIKKISILAIMTLTVLSTTSAMAVDASSQREEEIRVRAEQRMDILIGESASAARLTAQATALYNQAVAKAKAEAEAKAAAEAAAAQAAAAQAAAEAKAKAEAKAAAEAAARRQVAAKASRSQPRPAAPVVAPADSSRAAQAVAFAMSQVGKRYVYGAVGPNAYDCSGLTMAAWRSAGVGLPHSSRAQIGAGTRVSRDALQPGDLVFYYSPISHVGIYIGGGRIVDAANPRTGVRITSVGSMLWGRQALGIAEGGAKAPPSLTRDVNLCVNLDAFWP